MFGPRTLKDHTFLFPMLQESAFVASYFGVGEGVGTQSTNRVPFGTLGRRDIHLAGLEQNMDFALTFTRWLGLFLHADGQAILGVNVSSLFLRTGELTAEGSGGLVGRIFRVDSTGSQLSVRGFGGAGTVRRVSLLPLIENLESNPAQTVLSALNGNLRRLLLIPGSRQRAGGSLNFAQVLTRDLSLQASGGVEYIWSTFRPFDPVSNTEKRITLNTLRPFGAAALAFDAAAFGVPIAVMGEYRVTWQRERSEEDFTRSGVEHTVGGGLYYSGRRDLQLGLGGTAVLSGPRITGVDENGAAAQSDPPTILTVQFIFRYVW